MRCRWRTLGIEDATTDLARVRALPRSTVTRDPAAFHAPPPFVPIARWMETVLGIDATRPSWIR